MGTTWFYRFAYAISSAGRHFFLMTRLIHHLVFFFLLFLFFLYFFILQFWNMFLSVPSVLFFCFCSLCLLFNSFLLFFLFPVLLSPSLLIPFIFWSTIQPQLFSFQICCPLFSLLLVLILYFVGLSLAYAYVLLLFNLFPFCYSSSF